MKPKLAVTGGKGLVGSRFVTDFADTYDFVHLDISDPTNPVDITNYDQVMSALQNSDCQAIIHLAAFTDVTAAWKQTGMKDQPAYIVNVKGTETMVQASNELSAQLIHISTAYVFNGEKQELYNEADPMSPIEWYGQTKAWAEDAVVNTCKNWTILRIDQPFRPDAFPKADVVHKVVAGLQAGTLYPQFNDHNFGPTFIPDFAKVLDWAIRTKTTGLFHGSSGESWSDFEFAKAIAQANGMDPNMVKPGSLTEYLKTSERPYQKNTAMSSEKLKKAIDFHLSNIKEVLKIHE